MHRSQKNLVVSIALSLVVMGIGGVTAQAEPISTCAKNGLNSVTDPTGAVDYTCYIYPTDGSGDPSSVSFVTPPPGSTPITSGYLVLLFPGDNINGLSSRENPANWDEVLDFVDNGTGVSTQFELLTASCNCFAPLATTINEGATFYDAQNPNGIYLWYPELLESNTASANHLYNIYTAEAAAIPEPTSAYFTLIGLVSLLVIRKMPGF